MLEILEELQLIVVLEKSEQPLKKLSEKYASKIPAEIGRDLQKQLQESRTGWNNRDI